MNRLKSTVFVLVTVLGLGSIASSVTAAVLSIHPPDTTIEQGERFSLNVHVSDVTDIYALQFDLTYNPAILSVDSVGEGASLVGTEGLFFIPGVIDNDVGKVTYTAATLYFKRP
jgi:hypothetical protein